LLVSGSNSSSVKASVLGSFLDVDNDDFVEGTKARSSAVENKTLDDDLFSVLESTKESKVGNRNDEDEDIFSSTNPSKKKVKAPALIDDDDR